MLVFMYLYSYMYVVLICSRIALKSSNASNVFVCLSAVERAGAIARQADIIAGLSMEVLKGTTKAFDSGEWCLLNQIAKIYGIISILCACLPNLVICLLSLFLD